MCACACVRGCVCVFVYAVYIGTSVCTCICLMGPTTIHVQQYCTRGLSVTTELVIRQFGREEKKAAQIG